ncbi:MAG: VOC family protein [Actinomycetota bacterium]
MRIEAIDVAYIHSQRGSDLARWFEEALGVPTTYADEGWHEYGMKSGSRFAVDKTSFPRSVVEHQAVMLSFLVDDIHAAVAELAAKGVSFFPDTETTIFDAGPTLVATFADPDGNWHQLSQPKQAK